MSEMHKMAAAMAMLSLGGMGGGYGPRVIRFGDRREPSAPLTPEMSAEHEARRVAAAERRALADQERAERKARWQAVYDPQYHSEPQRSDFASRQAYRAAHRKWQSAPAIVGEQENDDGKDD